MRPTKVLAALATTMLNLISNLCFAHQIQHATSLIDFKTNNIVEISHRFYTHDAEAVSASLLGKHEDLLQSQQAQDTLCVYIIGEFQMSYQGHDPIPLETVGCEIEGKYFWAYQEAAYNHIPSAIGIKFGAFHETIPKHINLINVKIDQRITSLELKANDSWKRLTLDN